MRPGGSQAGEVNPLVARITAALGYTEPTAKHVPFPPHEAPAIEPLPSDSPLIGAKVVVEPEVVDTAPAVPLNIEHEVAESQAIGGALEDPDGMPDVPVSDVNVTLVPEIAPSATTPEGPAAIHIPAVGHDTEVKGPVDPIEPAVAVQVEPDSVKSSAAPASGVPRVSPTATHMVLEPQLIAAELPTERAPAVGAQLLPPVVDRLACHGVDEDGVIPAQVDVPIAQPKVVAPEAIPVKTNPRSVVNIVNGFASDEYSNLVP